MTFQTSIAASLPGLEITGEHIPAPKNWKDECAEIIVQNDYDVETPYMVESWLKGKILQFIFCMTNALARKFLTNKDLCMA